MQQKEPEPPASDQSASPSITPESPTGEDNSRFVFKKQVQEVFLHATVVDETGRPVTIQDCLLKGVNDSPEQAQQLAQLVGARRMHVNLLWYNPTGLSLKGVAYERADADAGEAFVEVLRAHGVVAHFRRPRGRDIDAACGQLRRRAITSGTAGTLGVVDRSQEKL